MNDDLTKNLLSQLSKQDKLILADLWESDASGALKRLFGQRQLQIAQQTLKSSADHYYTVENRGRANELAEMVRMMSKILKEANAIRAGK